MAPSIPLAVPSALRAGDTWKWKVSNGDFPASDGWVLAYELRCRSAARANFSAGTAISGAEITADGNSFAVVVAAADTARLSDGAWEWVAFATLGAERYQFGSGRFTVLPNLAEADERAVQSHAERTLSVIEAALEGRLTEDMESYQIAGRAVTRIPINDLFALRSKYLTIVSQERRGTLARTVAVTFVKEGAS